MWLPINITRNKFNQTRTLGLTTGNKIYILIGSEGGTNQ